MKKTLPLLALLFLFVFSSCQKEESFEVPSQSNADPLIEGDWKFVGVSVEAESSSFVSDVDGSFESITITNYKSIGNTGVLRFNNGKLTGTNISYSIDTTVKAKFYIDGVLDSEFDFPFSYSYPAYNATANYQRIGNDSLYFPNGSFLSADTSGMGIQNQPTGVKYRIEGNKLIFYDVMNQQTTATQSGVTSRTSVKMDSRSIMERM